MSILDRFRTNDHSGADTEQLAPDDPAPRGEDRDAAGGYVLGSLLPFGTTTAGPRTDIEASPPPSKLATQLNEYGDFPFVDAGLQLFADTVLEPGYRISATIDGSTDEDMETALTMWARECAIHAGMINQDLGVILDRLVKRRRMTGTEFLELAGSKSDPDSLRALELHDPSTFEQFARADQAILVQTDDEVPADHPRTPSGDPAAYVQYHESLAQAFDRDPVAFSQDELLKFVYDPAPGNFWGTSIFDKIGGRIDALTQKWADRDMAIHQTGHPHRIYFSKNWSLEEATEYATAHEQGEVSAREDTGADEDGRFAGRVDFVSDEVGIETADAQVADIMDAVMDDVQAIFAVLPVSRYKLAYEESINQFVVEPQQEKDDLLVDQEREYLRRKFEPVFERKADELAGGNYDGTIGFRIEPSEDENPLRRESFPRENLNALGDFIESYYQSGASQDIPIGGMLDMTGIDADGLREEFGFEPDELGQQALDETTPAAQAQQDAFDAADEATDT